jgi:peptidoglycan/LPS O-acetylase OafA/YrhL
MRSQHRFLGIDIIRFVAASQVMWFHLAFWSWAPAQSTPSSILQGLFRYPELTAFSWFGWVGVEIFFVISGLVIAHSAEGAGAARFLRNRILRLLPTVLICATVTATVLLLAGSSPLDVLVRYARTITFWPSQPWIDGVYWTLVIEIQFYALVLALIAMKRAQWIEPGLFLIGLTGIATWLLGHWHISTWVDFGLARYGMYFAAGVMIWNGFNRGWSVTRLGALTLMLVGGCLPILAEASSKSRSFDLGNVQLVPILIWVAGVLAIWCSLIFDSIWSRFLRPNWMRAVRLLGLSTYPLYLLHDVVGASALRVLGSAGAGRFEALFLACTAMIAASLWISARPEPQLRAILSRAVSWGSDTHRQEVGGVRIEARVGPAADIGQQP